jgi:hypothetical protein
MPEYDKPRKPAQPATSPPQQALRNKPPTQSSRVAPKESAPALTSDSPLQIPGSHRPHRRLQTPDYHPRPHQKTLRCEMKAKTPETPGSNHPTAPVATPT